MKRSLYREYRPQGFDELLGQDHVVRTLRNAVESGAVAHAYIFAGPRGAVRDVWSAGRHMVRDGRHIDRDRIETAWRRAMADLLGQQLLLEPQHAAALPLLIPVPYHWSHAFSSSANTSELLAQGIATTCRWSVAQRIVRRTRKTSKQGLLSWAERKTNVRHAFSVHAPNALQGRQVWLVDDVMTSGATTAELARLLLKAGAAQVNVAVVARGTGVRESPSMNTHSQIASLP